MCQLTPSSELMCAAAVPDPGVVDAVVGERSAALGADVAGVRQPGEGLAQVAPLAAAVVRHHLRLAVLQVAARAHAAPDRRSRWNITLYVDLHTHTHVCVPTLHLTTLTISESFVVPTVYKAGRILDR